MRLFFALWPPPEITGRLDRIARSAAVQFGGKPTRQNSIHLTLSFMGEVPETRLAQLIEAAESVCAPAFELGIDRLGYWHHNHVLWAGTTTPPGALNELVSQLRAALRKAAFVVTEDGTHPFNPHLTLIRKLPLTDPACELPAIAPINWHCSSFALVRSQMTDGGSDYRHLCDFPLRNNWRPSQGGVT